ncbi:MAG: hypothetical protein ACP5HK_06780 [Acidilobus sp.]
MSLVQALGISLSSPMTIVVTIIEFLLGFAAGYVLFRGIKYILGFFLVLIIGDLLNVWKISYLNARAYASGTANLTTIEEALKSLAPYLAVLQPLFTSVVIFVGFLIGAAVAFLK